MAVGHEPAIELTLKAGGPAAPVRDDNTRIFMESAVVLENIEAIRFKRALSITSFGRASRTVVGDFVNDVLFARSTTVKPCRCGLPKSSAVHSVAS